MLTIRSTRRCAGFIAAALVTTAFSLTAQDSASPALSTGYEIDFDNQNIQVVLSALAKAAGVNVTFSRLPDIPVTLRLGQPVPKEELVGLMRQVAEGNGLVMRQTGSLIHISQPGDSEGAGVDMGPPPDVRIYTYRLKHNNAAELAPVLASILSGTGAQGRGPARGNRNGRRQASGGSGGGGSPISFSLGDIGSGGSGVVMLRGSSSGNGTGGSGSSIVTPLNGSQLAQMLGGASSRNSDNNRNRGSGNQSGNRATSGDHIHVVAEEYTNTLLVRATPEEWAWIKPIIEELD